MIVLFHTNIYRKLNCYLFFPPGGEYPDGDPPGDMDPGKLKRCPLGPFIPGPFGILGWNLAVVSKVCDSVFFGRDDPMRVCFSFFYGSFFVWFCKMRALNKSVLYIYIYIFI